MTSSFFFALMYVKITFHKTDSVANKAIWLNTRERDDYTVEDFASMG